MRPDPVKLGLFVAAFAAVFLAVAWLIDIDALGARFGIWERAWLLLLTVLLAALTLGSVARGSSAKYIATLVGTAMWLPFVAAIWATALYIAPIAGTGFWRDNAALVGTVLAADFWLLYALVDPNYAAAGRQSPGWHGLLRARIEELWRRAHGIAETPCVEDVVRVPIREETLSQLNDVLALLDSPGLSWVTRAGFNTAWTQCHRADEALLQISDKETVLSTGITDILRLSGSKISGEASMEVALRKALIELDPKVEQYVTRLMPAEAKVLAGTSTCCDNDEPQAAGNGAKASAQPDGDQSATEAPSLGAPAETPAAIANDCASDRRARAVIRALHASLNAYRGSRWAELGRARWQLVLTTTVAGLVAYLVLALALISQVDVRHVIAGWAFFLVGAAAGLFLRLRQASEEEQIADDYGLESARLYQTPLLSGMAAVLGVLLMASIAGSTLAAVIAPQESATAVDAATSADPVNASPPVESPAAVSEPSGDASERITTAEGDTQPTNASLDIAFDLRQYPIGLVLAVIFGLTPGLVLSRLGVSVNAAKMQIVATRPS